MESLHEISFGCQVTAIGASASLESAVQPSAIGSQDPAAESRTAGTRTPDYRARHPPPETIPYPYTRYSKLYLATCFITALVIPSRAADE